MKGGVVVAEQQKWPIDSITKKKKSLIIVSESIAKLIQKN